MKKLILFVMLALLPGIAHAQFVHDKSLDGKSVRSVTFDDANTGGSTTVQGTPGNTDAVVLTLPAASGTLCTTSSCPSGGGGGSGTPGGSNTDVQYNSSGAFAGNGGFIYTGTNVGINSTAPGAVLDVQGTVRATNFVGSGLGLTGLPGASGAPTTYVVCASDKTATYACNYTATGTNDQIVMQSAEAAASALPTGGTILFTEGHFYIGANGNYFKPLSNVKNIGIGQLAGTVFVGSVNLGNNPVVYDGTGTLPVLVNGSFESIKIDGTAMRANTWFVQQKCLSLPGTDHYKIFNVWAYNCPATGIAADGGTNLNEDSNIEELNGTLAPNGPGGSGSSTGTTNNGSYNGSNGIGNGYGQSSGSPINVNSIINNNLAIDNANSGIDAAEEQPGNTVGVFGLTVSNSVSIGNYNGFSASGSSVSFSNVQGNGNVHAGIQITSNVFANIPTQHVTIGGSSQFLNNTGYGIQAVGSKVLDLVVSGTVVAGNSLEGIITSASESLFTGNSINNNQLEGILFNASSTLNTRFTGNNIYDNGLAGTSGSNDGLNITGSTSANNIQVDNNWFYDDQGTHTQRYGLTLNGSGIALAKIYYNTFHNNLTGSFNPAASTSFAYIGTGNDNAGNLGVGTSAPAAQLDVVSAQTSGNTANFTDSPGTTGNTRIAITNVNGHGFTLGATGSASTVNANSFALIDTNLATYRMLIDANGNVGIGTTVPQGGLDVQNGTIPLLVGADNNANTRTNSTQKLARVGSFPYTNSALPNAIVVANNSSTANDLDIGGGVTTLDAATGVHFFTGATTTTPTGTERLTILSGGNVGFSSTNPGQSLDVQGTVRSSLGYYSGTTAGINCSGSPDSSFTVIKGIVTAC